LGIVVGGGYFRSHFDAKTTINSRDHLLELIYTMYTLAHRKVITMESKMSEEQIYEEDRKRVEKQRGFYKHL
jgi:hypothetical protein